jgi:ABC-2 type transport system ATP-binding protein
METIRIDKLSKSYGSLQAVKGVSLSVNRGEVLGLLGANGAGKSTLIECILGTRKPDQGSVSILGMDPKKERRRLFERVAVQFQESSYQEKITVEELCRLTHSLYQKPRDYAELLRRFGIADKVKKQVSELSGGQKQRLFIVLALIPDPEVVFLDELTTGLDTRARKEVWKCLSELKGNGLTIILTSHFMDEVEALCDRICILKRGEMIFQGTIGEAKEKSGCNKFEDAYFWFSDEEEKDYESI